jgi:hypothetical protein
MKYLIYTLTILISAAAGYAAKWFTSPLGCPLCICKSTTVDAGYTAFWLMLFDRYALPAGVGLAAWGLAVLVALGVIAVRVGRR